MKKKFNTAFYLEQAIFVYSNSMLQMHSNSEHSPGGSGVQVKKSTPRFIQIHQAFLVLKEYVELSHHVSIFKQTHKE